jgi:hypothetical protein
MNRWKYVVTAWPFLALGACSGGEVDIGKDTRVGVDVRHATLVGNPCIADAEFHADYSGYELPEIHLQEGTEACSSGLCLAHHFQGRVSCPYGQTAEDLALPATDPRRCRLPRTSSSDPVSAVEVPVPPSFADRPAEDAAYCTCACGGPGADCTCPEGYACRELFERTGPHQGAPSLCVKLSESPARELPQTPCELGSRPGDPGYCGNGGYNP